MAGTWKTVSVFISSTFSDMHAERDWLVKRVFPRLRERLEKYHIHLVDIDLRWGVTREQADDDRVLDLCLQLVDQCRPMFIGILGERYGFVPKELPELSRPEFGWVQGMTGKSITELEIIHGVLNDHEMQTRSFFYFRDKSFLEDVPRAKLSEMRNDDAIMEPGDVDDPAEKLARLKQTIRNANVPVYEDYPCRYSGLKINWRLASRKLDDDDRERLEEIAKDDLVDAVEYAQLDGRLRDFVERESVVYVDGLELFGQAVYEQFWNEIREQHGLPDEPPSVALSESDWLAEEDDYHERFMESRLRVYVGRKKLQDDLFRLADSDASVPGLVTGPSGSGKSAVMANFVTEYRRRYKAALVIPHFVGASPGSTGLRFMLHRFCSILKREFDFKDEIPSDTNSLTDLFRMFVDRVPKNRCVLFVLDALNQLDERDSGHALNWLRGQLPAHVKIVASCINDPGRDEPLRKAFRYYRHIEFEIESLTDEERLEIVTQVPSLSAKRLDTAQVALLLENPSTKNPLFLLVALEELRGFGSFADLDDRIQSFPREGDTVTALFQQVIRGLEAEFGENPVRSVFSLLASSRSGLSECELKSLLGEDGQADNLFPILCHSRRYLQPRGELVDFFHRGLDKAVREMYLASDAQQLAAHRRLAACFYGQLNPPDSKPWSGVIPRALAEITFHQARSKSWDALESTLCDLRFVQAKFTCENAFEVAADYSLALDVLPDSKEEQERERRRQTRLRKYTDELISSVENNRTDSGLPTPPDSKDALERMRRAEAATGNGTDIPLDGESEKENRATRIREFENFISTKSQQLKKFPADAVLIAYNHASEGAVFSEAKRLLDSSGMSWLMRDPRPPGPPGRPLCLRRFGNRPGSEPSGARSLAMTTDGRLAVSSFLNKTICVWNLKSGRRVRELKGHDGWIKAIALTPDGNIAASVADDQTLRVWDVARGECLRTIRLRSRFVSSVLLTANGKRASTISVDLPTIRIWDIQSGKLLGTLKTPGGDRFLFLYRWFYNFVGNPGLFKFLYRFWGGHRYLRAIAQTPDGSTVISAGSDRTLRVWDATSGGIQQTLEGHEGDVNSLALTPDGKLAVSAGNDRTLCVWDVSGGKLLGKLNSDDYIKSVAVTPDGRTAVSADLFGNTIKVWDVARRELLRTITGHVENLEAAVVSPDGLRAVSSDSRDICVWNVADGAMAQSLECHNFDVKSIAIARNKGWIISADKGACCVWDLDTVKLLRKFQGNISFDLIAIVPDGNRAITSSQFGLCVWDLNSGECTESLVTQSDSLQAVAITPDGKRAVSGGRDKILRVWDGHVGTLLRSIELNGSIDSVVLAPNGSRAILDVADTSFSVVEVVTGELSGTIKKEKEYCHPPAMAFTTAGDKVLLSNDQQFCIWDIKNGQCLHTIDEHFHPINSIVVSAHGDRAISASQSELRVWNVSSGKCLATLEDAYGPEAWITVSDFTPDGACVVYASSNGNDTTVKLWDINRGRMIGTYQMVSRATSLCVVSGSRFIVGAANGQLHFLTLMHPDHKELKTTGTRDLPS